ncbi:MAG TPA: deaminase [Candidatus Limnocylindrales bacterium]|nr:deaminase [Candidatus Limnocylindrales bacterium]
MDRARRLQDAGNNLCRRVDRSDAMAFVAVSEIRNARTQFQGHEQASGSFVAPETAYLVWSLKRPSEVDTLRAIYRTRLFVISVHTPYQRRRERLAQAYADAGGVDDGRGHTERAAELIDRDEREAKQSNDPHGQNVSDTYPLADFFVDAYDRQRLAETLGRAIRVIFGDPFTTPSRGEFGMQLAETAALKSAELGRQVGAAILTEQGDVVTTGTNEVPRPGGGHFWEGDPNDDREFTRGADTSDRLRHRLLNEVVGAVTQVVDGIDSETKQSLIDALEDTRLADLIEFGRAVHAEMAALVDAARRGARLSQCVLYVTTFPCHLCTRMIIAAGITRVEYIYPYPKSLSGELYGKQIDDGRGASVDPGAMPFIPFLGVAPRRYSMAFTARPRSRRDSQGRAVRQYDRSPRLLIEDEFCDWDLSTHQYREVEAVAKAEWLPDIVGE